MLFVFDLDGVVYRGDAAVPGAVPALRRLDELGHLLYFLTNNSTRSRADYAAKLTGLGIPTHPERIMTSAYATGLYLQDQGCAGKSVAMIGERGLAEEMRLAGLRVLDTDSGEQADFVVVGLDRELTFPKLAAAYRQVAGGARFIATNRDGTYPMEEGREIPGGGAMVAALEACAGPAELTIGKPEPTTWREILALAGVEARDAVMVGDRAETDILGARQVGMTTILVLTGVTREADLPHLPPEQRPDYVLPAVADLPGFLEAEGMAGDRLPAADLFNPILGNAVNHPAALTIAGSDSSAGAGLQMDLKVFAALGVWGCCAATTLTAQNSRGIERVHHVPPRFVSAQIDAVADDLRPAAVKTGALGRPQAVAAVAGRIRRRRLPNLVIDPVILAKDRTPLLSAHGVEALKRLLLPLARVVTPNLLEAEALSGVSIGDDASLRAAARAIAASGAAVVIKGGHRPGPPTDLLFEGDRFLEFGGERLPGPALRGTGCIYSAALAAGLALGCELEVACESAKAFVEAAIRSAIAMGKGAPVSRLGIFFALPRAGAEG